MGCLYVKVWEPCQDQPHRRVLRVGHGAQADRDGESEALAIAYQGSMLWAANDERLRADAKAAGCLPPGTALRSGTTTPFAFGLWVILKARACTKDSTSMPPHITANFLAIFSNHTVKFPHASCMSEVGSESR